MTRLPKGQGRGPGMVRAALAAVVIVTMVAEGSNGVAVGKEGLTYTHFAVPEGPWSIHVVRWPRFDDRYRFSTTHAEGGALGMSVLSEQLLTLDPSQGRPVAAVNGDFYQAVRAYAGDPRGLQIVDGEVISAPVSGSASFWLGARGVPRMGMVLPELRVTWPDGTTTPFGLNEERPPGGVVLYTPSLSASTRTQRGREFVLEPSGAGIWLPLRMGETYRARVREVFDSGDTAIPSGTMVLSVGPLAVGNLPRIEAGATIGLSTASSPGLEGATAAISGGPVLVRGGKAQGIEVPDEEDYQFSSMTEQHPRVAVGWNRHDYFMVVVDGRQKGRAEGMTLEELARYLVTLGCEEALNLDGGGSATLWHRGEVRNRPCDGVERPIANALVVLEVPGG